MPGIIPTPSVQVLVTLCIDVDITEDLRLASETHVGVLFFEIAAQPEFLTESERAGVGRGRNHHAIRTAEAIAMTVTELPDTAVDRHIMFQRGIAHIVAGRNLNLHIFTHIRNRWHDFILQGYDNSQRALASRSLERDNPSLFVR